VASVTKRLEPRIKGACRRQLHHPLAAYASHSIPTIDTPAAVPIRRSRPPGGSRIPSAGTCCWSLRMSLRGRRFLISPKRVCIVTASATRVLNRCGRFCVASCRIEPGPPQGGPCVQTDTARWRRPPSCCVCALTRSWTFCHGASITSRVERGFRDRAIGILLAPARPSGASASPSGITAVVFTAVSAKQRQGDPCDGPCFRRS
jgi:hypothetical protein